MERFGFSADTIGQLKAMGHEVAEAGGQGVAEVIVFNQKDNMLEGGVDRRAPDGGAAGK
jgi:gamma-glutamyltranspeptidase